MSTVIILAGGMGKRMNTDISKQFICIKGKPILYYTIKRFMDSQYINKKILVLAENDIEYCKKNVLEKYSLKVDSIVVGGRERQDSVYNGLKEVNNSEIVLIHDGARPFVSNRIIKDGIMYAKIYGAAAPGVMPKDTIKIKDLESFSENTLKRDSLVAIQTPQVFKYDLIMKCHDFVNEKGISVTDDTMVVEMKNNKVYLYEGDYNIIKITTPEDLVKAE